MTSTIDQNTTNTDLQDKLRRAAQESASTAMAADVCGDLIQRGHQVPGGPGAMSGWRAWIHLKNFGDHNEFRTVIPDWATKG